MGAAIACVYLALKKGHELPGESRRSPFASGTVPRTYGWRDQEEDEEDAPEETLERWSGAPAGVPVDVCVPVPTDVEPPERMDLPSALVLFHADGVASLREIAAKAEIPLAEAIESFYRLVTWGLVEVGGDEVPCSARMTSP